MSGIIFGSKQEQSQRFTQKGDRIPVTFVLTSPSYLVEIIKSEKTSKTAYAVIGFGTAKHMSKPMQGKLEKAGLKTPLRFLYQFSVSEYAGYSCVSEKGKEGLKIGETTCLVGEEYPLKSLFVVGDLVAISGTSKGKGFQGVVKRHGFKGGPRTRGQSHGERAPGSIGSTTTPGRVFKGKRMAGRMGNQRVTLNNMEIVELTDKGMWVKGLIPGSKGSVIELAKI